MRLILGLAVFVIGVGILGWWGSTSHAPRMEDRVQTAAADTLGATVHPVTTRVSGRDIVVTGLANSDAEKQAIVDRLNAADGRRVVRDRLDVLPMATPYVLRADNDGAAIAMSGNIPTQAGREDLATATGTNTGDLVMAAGVPDAAWTGVAQSGIQAVGHLENGTFDLTNRTATLTGLAALPQDRDMALAALDSLPNGYSLDDQVELQDDGTPMRLNMTLNADGVVTRDSKLPMDASFAALQVALGQSTNDDDTLMSTIAGPTADWSDFATSGVAALGALNAGQLMINDRDLTLTGDATRAGKANALEMLGAIGGDYTVAQDIALTDDGQPFSLNAQYDGTSVASSGKVPFGTAPDLASATMGVTAGDAAINVAEIDDASGTWTGAATSSLTALNAMDAGELMIQDRMIDLRGTATRSGRDAAMAALATVPAGYDVTEDITLADDGRPFQMSVDFDGTDATANGKLPFGMSGDDVARDLGVAPTGAFDVAEIASDADAWPQVATTGLNALSKLQNGSLNIMGQDVTLTGTAVTPDNGTQIANLLQNLPAGFTATTEFDYLDDGTAPSFDVQYSVDRGAAVSGKLPAGLSAPDIAEALNLTSIQSTATEGLTGAPEAATDALTKLSAWLPELNSAKLSTQDEDIRLAAVAEPGVDMELLTTGLTADFPDRVDIQTVPALPATGSDRVNALSGLREQFTGVAWVPMFDFGTSVDACQRATIDIMQQNPIGFVTGGARLDATSMRGINALAGLIGHCNADGAYSIEVAGHTDSQGGEGGNQRLSQARAQSVYDALTGRGVAADMLTATGYGETTPIADNGTAEGRAANRRTELVWSDTAPVGAETQGE